MGTDNSEPTYEAVYEAATQGDTERLGRLLADGADPNGPGDGRFPPLHGAAFHEHADAIAVLLAHGANADARFDLHPVDAPGYAAIHHVADHLSCLRVFLAHDPGLSLVEDGRGRTPWDHSSDAACQELLTFAERGGTIEQWDAKRTAGQGAAATADAAGELWLERLPSIPAPPVPDALSCLDRRHKLVDNRAGRWVVQGPGGGLSSFVLGDSDGLHETGDKIKARGWVAACSPDRKRYLIATHKFIVELEASSGEVREVLPTKSLGGDVEALGYIDDKLFLAKVGAKLAAWTLTGKNKRGPVYSLKTTPASIVATPLPGIVGIQAAEVLRHEMLLCRAKADGLYPIGRLGGHVHQLWADEFDGQLRCLVTLGPYAEQCWELHNLLTTASTSERLTAIPDADGIRDSLPALRPSID